jgi:hypothetical protein
VISLHVIWRVHGFVACARIDPVGEDGMIGMKKNA